MNKSHVHFFSEHVTIWQVGETGFWALVWVLERLTILHPPQPLRPKLGARVLRGWPKTKPQVYTASGSVQIKTVIIDLGLDWALFEKMEGGWWGG